MEKSVITFAAKVPNYHCCLCSMLILSPYRHLGTHCARPLYGFLQSRLLTHQQDILIKEQQPLLLHRYLASYMLTPLPSTCHLHSSWSCFRPYAHSPPGVEVVQEFCKKTLPDPVLLFQISSLLSVNVLCLITLPVALPFASSFKSSPVT